jgi:CHAT domain-containing protein
LPGGLSGWIVNRKGVVQHWIDEKRAKLLASRFTELVASSESPMLEISARGQELFGLLVKPFADNLPPDGTIVIDGDGVLASIPWSALEDQPGHQLVERFSFSQGLGLAEAFRRSDKVPTRFYRPLIFGPPLLVGELSRQYPTLPEASREAKELHRRLAYSVLLEREQATSSAFRRYAPQSTLFHFAGHGISYGGFGALLFAPLNGSDSSTQYMTANDIAGLDLSRLQLVVLAACSSGVGEQSGIVNLDSLTRAFLEAGASRVIAAGWDVDSSNTADLMSAFYDHLTANRNPAEALRQAQLRVRLSAPHPRQWAGFSLFGEP